MADPKWLSIVAEAARQTLESSGHGLLLSKVPTILRNASIEPDDILNGRKLREFLQNEGRSKIILLQSESRPELWAVLPSSVDPQRPFSAYFEVPENRDPTLTRRFLSPFWQAFIRPIPHGHRRWLLHTPTLHCEDLIGNSESPEAIEIERQFTSQPDELVIPNSLVIERIEAWANHHGINANSFLSKEISTKHESKHAERDSLLHHITSALADEDLSRVSLPLDIVRKLLITK